MPMLSRLNGRVRSISTYSSVRSSGFASIVISASADLRIVVIDGSEIS